MLSTKQLEAEKKKVADQLIEMGYEECETPCTHWKHVESDGITLVIMISLDSSFEDYNEKGMVAELPIVSISNEKPKNLYDDYFECETISLKIYSIEKLKIFEELVVDKDSQQPIGQFEEEETFTIPMANRGTEA